MAIARAEAEGDAAGAGLGHAFAGELAPGPIGPSIALVEMPRRVLDRPMPAVGTIDLRGARARGALAGGAISRHLHDGDQAPRSTRAGK